MEEIPTSYSTVTILSVLTPGATQEKKGGRILATHGLWRSKITLWDGRLLRRTSNDGQLSVDASSSAPPPPSHLIKSVFKI